MWGVKAAKYIVPHLLDQNAAAAQPLCDAVVHATARFPHNPAIVDDAYEAFAGEEIKNPAGGSGVGARAVAAMKPLRDLMECRAGLFQAAQQVAAGADPDLPADPAADKLGLTFMAHPVLWQKAPPAARRDLAQAHWIS